MKKYLWILVPVSFLFLLFSSLTKKEEFNPRQVEVNKNYMFCSCMAEISLRYHDTCGVMDGSNGVYFIDDFLVIDIEESMSFVKSYLDSLDKVDAYRSYREGNSLGIAKCLDMYNSERLDKFVKQKIKERRNE